MCRFRVYSLGFWVRRFEGVMEGMFLSKQSPCKRTVIYKGPLAGSIFHLTGEWGVGTLHNISIYTPLVHSRFTSFTPP